MTDHPTNVETDQVTRAAQIDFAWWAYHRSLFCEGVHLPEKLHAQYLADTLWHDRDAKIETLAKALWDIVPWRHNEFYEVSQATREHYYGRARTLIGQFDISPKE